MRFALFVLFGLFTLPTAVSAQNANPYCGCLLFVDDIRKPDELTQVRRFSTSHLLRSWYRFGDPAGEKHYGRRADVIQQLRAAGITVGGGTSLSVVNNRDIAGEGFDASWLSVELTGAPVRGPGRQYGTLSAPGFRTYLVNKLVAQAKLGIIELHLGEPNGEIRFDDWTLGLKGDAGFIQWIREKYKGKPPAWWENHLGPLGKAIFSKSVSRKSFVKLPGIYKEIFMREWGTPDSWEGKNREGEPAFLAFLYRKNLESFLSELRAALRANGLSNVKVDVWGFAVWMRDLTPRPDAFISSPPDERWGLNWSNDAGFSLEKNAARIRRIMTDQIQSAAPSPVVYMIDHPKQFQEFVQLPDRQQASLIKYFSQLTKELGANVAFRVYAGNGKEIEGEVVEATRTECEQRVRFCPNAINPRVAEAPGRGFKSPRLSATPTSPRPQRRLVRGKRRVKARGFGWARVPPVSVSASTNGTRWTR